MKKEATDRLFEYTYQKKINDSAVGLIIGSDRSFISNIKKGIKKLSFNKFDVLIEHPEFNDLDLNWLFRGKIKEQHHINNQGTFAQQQIDGKKNTMHISPNYKTAENEINYLKEIIATKNKHIELLEKMLEK